MIGRGWRRRRSERRAEAGQGMDAAGREVVRAAERIVGEVWIEQLRSEMDEAEASTGMLRRRRADALETLGDAQAAGDPLLAARAQQCVDLVEEAYAERLRIRDWAQRKLARELACFTAAARRRDAEAEQDREALGPVGDGVAPRTDL